MITLLDCTLVMNVVSGTEARSIVVAHAISPKFGQCEVLRANLSYSN